MAPRLKPASEAIKRPSDQLPPPICMTATAMIYWTTEAATAREISMPPRDQHDQKTDGEYDVDRAAVQKIESVGEPPERVRPRPRSRQIAAMTRSSHDSVDCGSLAMDRIFTPISRHVIVAIGYFAVVSSVSSLTSVRVRRC